ncbi:MAG: RNHCP domain-containing protein [Thermomicrobiales bacterium]
MPYDRSSWTDDDSDTFDDGPRRGKGSGRKGGGRSRIEFSPRSERDQAFKCGKCKQFIGAPVSGGRQRNHCPNCLYSRHVDDTMPGDRKSDCHGLMAPVGTLFRRNGEQMILHVCNTCGKESPNRIAADDNPVLIEELPVLADDPTADAVAWRDLIDPAFLDSDA